MSDTPASKNPLKQLQAYFKGHPTGFYFFFWGELAERCSYYGMNAILTIYLTNTLLFTKSEAARWVNYFIAATYLTPLLGGFIADRFLGRYWTIVAFSIPYVIGNALMIYPLGPGDVIKTESGFVILPIILIAALIILAFGSGVIKPNISTLMGMTYDQQRPGQDQLRSDAFAMFYWSINVGSLISQLSMPRIRDYYGPNIAFLLPTILMTVALVLFALGKRFYAVETIGKPAAQPGTGTATAEQPGDTWKVLLRLLGVFVICTVFWSIFKHYPTVWVFFTGEKINTTLGSTTYKPDQFQFLNALFILTLLPLSTVFFKWLASRGIKLRPTDKMQIGFIFTALTPCIFVLADMAAGDGKTSLAWIVLAYLCITLAEVFISPVGLELAFVAAPKSMKGFITACFLFTIFAGSLINAQVTPLYSKEVIDTDTRHMAQSAGFFVSGLASAPLSPGGTYTSALELSLASAKEATLKRYTPTQYFGAQAIIAFIAVIAFFFIAIPFNRRLAGQQQATQVK